MSSLVEALTKGTSNTALAAISTLLEADIRALGGSDDAPAGAPPRSARTASTALRLPHTGRAIKPLAASHTLALCVAGAAQPGGRAAQVLLKLRQLPWQRPAVLRAVIKLLGQLARRSGLAMEELQRLAAYAMANLKQVRGMGGVTPACCLLPCWGGATYILAAGGATRDAAP